jgi:hypothetical protein
LRKMSSAIEPLPPDAEWLPDMTTHDRLTMLLLKPELPTATSGQARLEELIGREFARFLIASISNGQGRRG